MGARNSGPEGRDAVLQAVEKFDGPKCAVLLATGSYSPAHLDHVGVVAHAAAQLRAQGHTVVGALLSPSHDHYVSCKLGGEAVAASTRLKVLKGVLRDSPLAEPWMHVDAWEVQQEGFADHPVVGRSLVQRFKAAQLREKVELFYVAGADLYNNCCGRGYHTMFDGVVVVGRAGESALAADTVEANCLEGRRHLFAAFERPGSDAPPDLSSTLVRRAAREGDWEAVERMVGPTGTAVYRKALGT